MSEMPAPPPRRPRPLKTRGLLPQALARRLVEHYLRRRFSPTWCIGDDERWLIDRIAAELRRTTRGKGDKAAPDAIMRKVSPKIVARRRCPRCPSQGEIHEMKDKDGFGIIWRRDGVFFSFDMGLERSDAFDPRTGCGGCE